MPRPKLNENQKRKKLNVTIDPIVHEQWIKFCEKNNITNQSLFIEEIIKEKIKKNNYLE